MSRLTGTKRIPIFQEGAKLFENHRLGLRSTAPPSLSMRAPARGTY
jgi:hypothetical protein